MFEVASLIVFNLIIAGLLGLIIGYIIGRNSFPSIKPVGYDNRLDD